MSCKTEMHAEAWVKKYMGHVESAAGRVVGSNGCAHGVCDCSHVIVVSKCGPSQKFLGWNENGFVSAKYVHMVHLMKQGGRLRVEGKYFQKDLRDQL